MSATPDGDDDELVDIEIELDGPLPRPDAVERADDDAGEPEREPTNIEAWTSSSSGRHWSRRRSPIRGLTVR